MQNVQPNLFTRDDTFFGVCQGLGEDIGINPNWLRIAIPGPLFFLPVETIAAYAAAGLLVLATRLIFPNPRAVEAPVAGAAAEPAAEAAAETVGQAEPEAESVPLAA